VTSAAAIDNLSLLRFAELIDQRLGLQLDSSSLEELELVLCARIRALRCGGFDSYRRRLEAAGSRNAELGELAQKLAIGETYFFRSSEQFTVFSEVAIPRLMRANRARPLRILSAGCATGEEPYSLAITIRELGASAPARVSILGFDINPESIAKARAGRYSAWAMRAAPPAFLRNQFER
jgi:chemotaxis protein methyltransferase CheR